MPKFLQFALAAFPILQNDVLPPYTHKLDESTNSKKAGFNSCWFMIRVTWQGQYNITVDPFTKLLQTRIFTLKI